MPDTDPPSAGARLTQDDALPPRTGDPSAPSVEQLAELASGSGLHRVNILAWRDLEDPEAGGSEIHAANIAKLWAEAGIEVTMRTSFSAGMPQVGWRDGYRVIRKAGRYMVFPRAAFSETMGWHGNRDGLVEIWNGMPFFSPLWVRGPRCVFLHHVHKQMWQMALPPRLALAGDTLERRVAPKLYRQTPVITLSESSKHELVHELGFRSERVTVVPPGIDPMFHRGGQRSPTPLVVAVGRLVPVKRFDLLIEALVDLKTRVPALEAVIVGEGYENDMLHALREKHGAEDWLTLAGRLSDADLIALYQRAWVLASASAREGWGMTITEAAACGTPAVVTRIPGHVDAVVEGSSGLLVDDPADLSGAIGSIVADPQLLDRLSAGALANAERYTWAATAYKTLAVLAADAQRRRP
ncbi:MAG: glycosyltransferase [Actinomycetia bacterium]|nr:glycosyltransferase [Actinomycetes bacterium]